ncbi:response regulator transcription factor [Aggregicoccus sp. 17bor-14]|uniref:LytR/AlgR family response regulator transcription factor n=1 Tax=Myxococcaceae TaxID=31 RepID=UPI00129C1532|nr:MULTISPECIES: LytTR family DNA-binding domain-containing protein [Myxococcaceae]MBF5041981.1 response regulator transcription factor [Simulacricoccus sp. 17bor-14]MRI87761.1 response regulator transcription factor [Aggregicoccus sp. 17bor-14]
MSQPLSVVIADDEPLARRRLLSLLRDEPGLSVVAECANGVELVDAVRARSPDLVFVDVQMPGLNGLEALAALEGERAPVTVFVTAYEEHARQAFDTEALDYVLKPIHEDRFRRAVSRARERVRERRAAALNQQVVRLLGGEGSTADAVPGAAGLPASEPRLSRIPIRTGDRVMLLDVEEIRWVEAEGDYLRFHTRDTSHSTRMTLSTLERQLDPSRFVRIHRSTLVRAAVVKELQPLTHGESRVVLHDGTLLKLSRTYRERLQQLLTQGA